MGNCRSDTGVTHSKKSGSRKVTLALFGLDNAGKTVTAKGFLGEEVETPTPTIGFSSVDFRHGKHDVTMYDLGGGRNIRGIWKNYFAEIHAAIFVIDSSAPTRLDECRKALVDVIRDEMIQGKPLLILANKQDVHGAMDETDICDHLQLEELVNAHKTPCRVESCSAALKKGLKNPKMDESIDEGFCWLLELVDEKWNVLSERVRRDMERKAEKDRKEKTERAERVRRSRELREKEEKCKGRVNGEVDGKRELDVDRDAEGDPFKPIKHQLETSLKKIEDRKKTRDQEIRRNGGHQVTSKPPHHESKSMENISWKPPTISKHSSGHDESNTKRGRSNRRSDSEEEEKNTARSRSSRGLDLDDGDQRPSARSRSSVDRDRYSPRSRHRSDDENNDPRLKSTSKHRTDDFEEERMEIRRLRNGYEPLKPISPTRITALKNGSDESVTDEDEVDRSGSSVYPSRTSKTRTLTPPVPLLRAAEADGYHQKWNGYGTAGNMAAVNNDKNKKKKKARFNQTAPALDSPEPYSSWRSTYSASPNGQRFHPSSTYPDRAEVRAEVRPEVRAEVRTMRTPLLQRLVETKAEDAVALKRRTKLSDEDDDEDIRPRTNTRDTYANRRPTHYVQATRKPNGHGHRYNSEDDDDDDDDDIIV